jgi:tRNA-Thr(GGU) m(6)t(6)A37 methyltransferase TsaA
MSAAMDLRAGEVAVDAPVAADAALAFIGRIRTPWATRADAPRQGAQDGPVCRLEVFPPWQEALRGLETFPTLDVLYWLHLARRDLVVQSPRHAPRPVGTFALRSPVRPNPIGLSRVALVGIEGATVLVRGLDCVDGTPLIDIKPDRCAHSAAKD